MAEKEVMYPSIDALEKELAREKYRSNYSRVLRSTVFSLLVVAAVAVLIAVLLMPVIQVSGMSMADTLNDGDIIVALRGVKYGTGDVIAFYYNNNILIKRVIARPGDWVNIDSDGNVTVNDVPLDEPYVTDKAFGDCNIPLPYQVPEGRFFLMGDHRATSIDSRNSAVGCISDDMVVGRLFVRVWPLKQMGVIE
ncbi:MAG: signal peptidase I [Ruminococcaceae bacterium]|jgi:signal peptidase I|nr:signal peptidase I [Oscillospiraceae bacterium]